MRIGILTATTIEFDVIRRQEGTDQKAEDLFVTLSAADIHWDDLMRHLPNYNEWCEGTAAERIRISRENLRNNPHIVAQWIHIRYTTFKNEVLYKKFNIVDEWNRYFRKLSCPCQPQCS